MPDPLTLSDLTPDPDNYNQGTLRGRIQLEESIRRNGAGRSILVSADNVILAGNTTTEVGVELDLPVRVIETDGTELIAVKRTDITAGTPQARELAYTDNRVSEVGLAWDYTRIRDDSLANRIDLAPYLRPDEILAIVTNSVLEAPSEAKTPGSQTDNTDWGTISLRVPLTTKQSFLSILARQPGTSTGEKFETLVEELLDRYGPA